MLPTAGPLTDVYAPHEIARAAGVNELSAIVAIGSRDALVPFAEAVTIGRALAEAARTGRDLSQTGDAVVASSRALFSMFWLDNQRTQSRSVPLVLSSTLHLTALAAFIATLGLTSTAATLEITEHPVGPARLVFIATPGPGGGGGGGGLLQKTPAPRALREGRDKMSSPLPMRQPPQPIVPVPAQPEPKPIPVHTEQLPPIVAPVQVVPSDSQNRVGVLEQTRVEIDSHGSGRGGGVGTGAGTGIGEGAGPGIGPGSGGGIGGGPYRPGSGITEPRLLREVKADYSEEARLRGIEGDIVLEIVVRRDGSVGDVKVLQGLGSGLNERATQAVRQWRFAPAERQGSPIDVIVEVAVEFKMR